MFGFSKKKNNDESIQQANFSQNNNQPMKSTKVEDDMASFEIPDFSDDDLNFDLGIGEFMPQSGLPPMPPEPKGLPTNPEEKPPVPAMQQEEAPSPDEKKQESTQQDAKSDENKLNRIGDTEELDNADDSDELPKFSVGSQLDFSEEETNAFEIKEPKNKKAKPEKKEHSKEHSAHIHKSEQKKDNIEHYAQASPEGFFVPKDVYRKIIILTDDVSKKAVYGEEVKRELTLLSKTEKEAISDAINDSKSVRDSIMSADLRLFGGN